MGPRFARAEPPAATQTSSPELLELSGPSRRTLKSSTTPAEGRDSQPRNYRVNSQPSRLAHVVLTAALLILVAFLLHHTSHPRSISLNSQSPRTTPAQSPRANTPDNSAFCPNSALFTTTVLNSIHPFAMSSHLEDATRSVVAALDFSDEKVNTATTEFRRQMDEGLAQDGTSISQIPSFVTAVPNGTEKGLYLAVDLGGTNFRVCSVLLTGDSDKIIQSEKKPIPPQLMTAQKPEELFEFMAKEIGDFLVKHHKEEFDHHVRRRFTDSGGGKYVGVDSFWMGFTFSFPVQQTGLNKGTLMRWTKGFDIPSVVGKDVCDLLQKAIDKLRLPVHVAALVNDTVGTLMARAYDSAGKKNTVLGAIFGTGTNGAYLESLDKVKKPIDGEHDTSTGAMVINTEWGSFDNQLNVLPNTSWDAALDKQTPNPGLQMYEKRVSGMFLGEILRLIIVELVKNASVRLFYNEKWKSNNWFADTEPKERPALFTEWGLDTSILSVAAADTSENLSNLRDTLKNELQIEGASEEHLRAFKAIADAVGRRAARLAAVAIAATVLQTGKLAELKDADDTIDVGVDGSLVEHYPNFQGMIFEAMAAVKDLGAENAKRISIGIAKDGSGVGAALIAQVAASLEPELQEGQEDGKADQKLRERPSRRGAPLQNLHTVQEVEGQTNDETAVSEGTPSPTSEKPTDD